MCHSSARQARPRRSVCVALLGCFALLLAACGGAASESAGASASVPAAAAAPAQTQEPTPAPTAKRAAPTSQPSAAGAEPGAPVRLRYFTFSAAPDHLADLERMIAAFKGAHPGIDIAVETAPFDEYFTKLDEQIRAGTPPDVFELNYENFGVFASQGALLDLTALAAVDPSFSERYYPRPYAAFRRDGYQYALPESFSNVVLFYNKALFDAAGVAYPTADWTWQDELVTARKLTNRSAGVWGEYSPIHFWEFYKTAAQNGCAIFGATTQEVTINQPGCVAALQWMVDKINKEHIAPTDAEAGGADDVALFKAGKVAMIRTGIWTLPQFGALPFAWDIALEPRGTQRAHHFFANAVALSATTPQSQAAWQWAQFFTSDPDVARIRTASNWELPALVDQAIFDDWLSQRPPESREVVFQALDTLVMPPMIDRETEMTAAIDALLNKAKAGELTPQQALDQAKIAIEALVE